MAEIEKEIKDVKASMDDQNKKMEAMTKVATKTAKLAAAQMDQEQQAKFKAAMSQDEDLKAAADDDGMKETMASIYDNVKQDENYHGPTTDPKIAQLEATIQQLSLAPMVANVIRIKGLTGKVADAETLKLMKASKDVVQAKLEELEFVAKKFGGMQQQQQQGNSTLSLSQMSAGIPTSDYDVDGTSQFSAKTDSELLDIVGGWK